jgi:hypothetical protein
LGDPGEDTWVSRSKLFCIWFCLLAKKKNRSHFADSFQQAIKEKGFSQSIMSYPENPIKLSTEGSWAHLNQGYVIFLIALLGPQIILVHFIGSSEM